MSEIEHLGKGAIPDSPDARDFKAPEVFGAAQVNWAVDFMLPEPPNEDQNGSGSCVGQAWSYYHWQLENKDFCRRDIYAWIFVPGGGAQIRDGGLRIVNYGQDTRNNVQDPNPETEAGMESRTGLDPNREKLNREINSFVLNKDIDSIAAGIETYKGVVFGLIGTNDGWQNIAMPRPPMNGDSAQWGHCLYLFGHHLHNGKKCLIAKSSWGTVGGTTTHHITEDYFIQSGYYIFNPWTLIKTSNTTMQLINDNGTFFLVGDKGKLGIADQASLAKLQSVESTSTTGSTVHVPQVGIIEQGFVIHN